jgi:poly(hydroxyalkanoate) granule-associated protein
MVKKAAPKAKNALVKNKQVKKVIRKQPKSLLNSKLLDSALFNNPVFNNKLVNTALNNELVVKGRTLVLDATLNVREKGEELIGNVLNEAKGLRKKAEKLAGNVFGDVQEQANGVLAQVKSAAAANLDWATDKAQDQVGKVLNRLGVPTKADVSELSRRVNELSKQVKLMKKAA